MCNDRRQLLRLFTLLSAAALTASCGKARPRAEPVAAGATVLALGDSLTFGTGATPDTS